MEFATLIVETVLIDRQFVCGEQDFVDHLRSLLPRIYRPTARRRGEFVVIAESRLFEIGVAERAGDVCLSVAPRQGFDAPGGVHPLAAANLRRTAEAVFLRLLLHYPLRVPTSGRMTAACIPLAERSAA